MPSEFTKRIDSEFPEPLQDYEVVMSRSAIGSMLRTAMMSSAEIILEQAKKSKFVLIQNRVAVPVVEFERIRRFIEGDANDEK